jgi:signal transduction histidine kinase
MNIQLLTLFVALCAAGTVFFSNPRRRINQAFTLLSLWSAVWLGVLWVLSGLDVNNPVPWIKAVSAIGAFFPWFLWWLAHCIISPEGNWRELFTRGKYWVGSASVLAAIASSNWFIPVESTRETRLWGSGAVVYNVGLLVCYLSLVSLGIREARRQKGIQLVEIKIFLIGGAISCMAGLALTMLPPMLGIPGFRGLAPLSVLFFYGLTAWGITSQKIFDARRLFLAVLRRGGVLVAASVVMLVWLEHSGDLMPSALAMMAGLSATVSLILFLERRNRWPSLSGRTDVAEHVRADILAAGRAEPDPDALNERYCRILRDWGRTDKAFIRSSDNPAQPGNPWALAPDSPALALLLEERWVTPESVARRRVTPALEEIEAFLAKHQIGVLVVSPTIRGTTPIAIALGRREDRMPFLWPEVEHLLGWSELIEVALSRAQLVKRARETEQVATAGLLGASLAHEIRNPLVALKTFAQLLPERHQDPEFRVEFSQVFQKEVARIESLTEQLLKLSSPRKPVLRPVKLNEIVHECAALMRPKFAESHIQLHLDLTVEERSISADSGSINQIVLNLLVNAQQALAGQAGERHVTIRTRLAPREITLDVIDNGPGVSPEQRPRLFQPFSSGKVNGFGLGLAMSANIMRGHRGSIALVDTDQPGATFRLTFPCPLS